MYKYFQQQITRSWSDTLQTEEILKKKSFHFFCMCIAYVTIFTRLQNIDQRFPAQGGTLPSFNNVYKADCWLLYNNCLCTRIIQVLCNIAVALAEVHESRCYRHPHFQYVLNWEFLILMYSCVWVYYLLKISVNHQCTPNIILLWN